jgi:hypothetical protein
MDRIPLIYRCFLTKPNIFDIKDVEFELHDFPVNVEIIISSINPFTPLP